MWESGIYYHYSVVIDKECTLTGMRRFRARISLLLATTCVVIYELTLLNNGELVRTNAAWNKYDDAQRNLHGGCRRPASRKAFAVRETGVAPRNKQASMVIASGGTWFYQRECQSRDIDGLVGSLYANMTEVSLASVEKLFFGGAHSLLRLLYDANQWLNRRIEQQHTDVIMKALMADESESLIRKAEMGLTFAELHDNGFYNSTELYSQHLERWALPETDSHIVLPGGHWRPKDCEPVWKVAIIIPYRDRAEHLSIFLRHIIPVLKRQKLEFAIYVVEQGNRLMFNRAMLMNVGFIESLKFTSWDCYILHDVDHLPINDRNYYGCVDMPKLLLSGANRWNYELLYPEFFGAVTGISRGQIERINGFPNVYWGWGGEDDDIAGRLKTKQFRLHRNKGHTALYDVIMAHHHSAPALEERFSLLSTYEKRLEEDGLTNLRYPQPIITLTPLFTNISVDIHELQVPYS